MNKNDNVFSIQEAMKFAQSPEGKALLSYLENTYGNQTAKLEQALKAGDSAAIRDQVNKMTLDPNLSKLLGRDDHE